MAFLLDGGSMPPAGSTGGSTGSIDQYAGQYGVTLDNSGAGAALGADGRPVTAPDGSPYLYLGTTTGQTLTPSNITVADQTTNPAQKLRSAQDLLSQFEKMSIDEQHKIALQLALSGYAGAMPLSSVEEWVNSAPLSTVESAYASLLGDAGKAWSLNQKVTPDDLLKRAISYRFKGEGIKWGGNLSSLDMGQFADLAEQAGVKVSSTGTTTSTSTSLDFMDPMDAKALTRGMLQQELGRDPTAAEYEDFLSTLHAAQAQDPTKTTTTTTTDASGNANYSTVTHQGMGADGITQVAQDKAQSNPDWAEWQAMGTYAPALFAALGSTVPGT